MARKKKDTVVKLVPKPAMPAEPKKRLISQEAAAWLRSRRPRPDPFALPRFPEASLPPPELRMEKQLSKKLTLAMDDASFQANSFNAGTWAASNGSGLWGYDAFLGYPELAVLAQRVEYRQIVTTMAREATREWIEFSVDGVAPEDSDDDELKDRVKELEDELGRLDCQRAFQISCEYDGYYGRGHLYIDTGHTEDIGELAKPLRPDKAKLSGKIKLLRPIEPVWIYPIKYESVDPLRPDWYNPNVWYVMGKNVHASRLLRFVSHEVPDLLKPAYSFGGLSMTQLCKSYVDIWLQTKRDVADLIHTFSMVWLSTDLSTEVAGTGEGGGGFAERMESYIASRDNLGVITLSKETEEIGNVAVPLGGLHELQSQAQEHLCSASGQPSIELLGVSPQGFNASSEGELDAWQRRVKSFQERLMGPNLKQVIELAQVSLWGEIDERINWKFKPLRLMSPKELSEIQERKSATHKNYVEMGAIDPAEVREAVAEDPDSEYDGIEVDDVPEQGTGEEDMDVTGEEPGPENQFIDMADNDKGSKTKELGEDTHVVPFAEDAGKFEEGKHPRGQPKNKGQFGPGGGSAGGSGGKQKPAVASVPLKKRLNAPKKSEGEEAPDIHGVMKGVSGFKKMDDDTYWKNDNNWVITKPDGSFSAMIKGQEINGSDPSQIADALGKGGKGAANRLADAAPEPSESEKQAIDDYVDNSWDINGKLRKGETSFAAEKLKGYLGRSQLPADVVAYRGVSGEFGRQLQKQLKIGHTLRDAGFMSTSVNKDWQKEWFETEGEHQEGAGGVMLQISMKKGQHAAMINPGEQDELLVQAGSHFKVTGYDPAKRVAKVELVQEDEKKAQDAWNESDHPRGQPENAGEFASGGSGGSVSQIKLKPSKKRVFKGNSIATKKTLTKLESGEIGENIAVAYLQEKGMKDAKALHAKTSTHIALDLVGDHQLFEIKTGLVSNGPSAQHWRATIGQRGKKEAAWLKKATPEQKKAWNAKKREAILERKQQLLAEFSKALGKKLKGKTICLIMNPDTKQVDMHVFDGFHSRISWNSPEAKKAYVGSFDYA